MRYNELAWELPAICLPQQHGGIPLSAFSNKVVNLQTGASHCPCNAERQAGKLLIQF